MLKDIRERKGLTMSELARLSGVAIHTIWSIEQGHKPKRVTLGKLARVLEVEIEEIERN